MTLLRRHIIEPLTSGSAVRMLALLVTAIPLGTLWFSVLVTGWALGLGLSITLLGLPILLGLAYVVRVAAEGERRLLEGLTGARLARPAGPGRERSVIASLKALAGDATIWREQAYLLLRFVAGLPLAVAAIAVIGAGGQMLAAPTYYHAGDGIDLGVWRVDTFVEALLLVPPGLLVLALSVPLVGAAGSLWVAIARGVLGSAPAGVPRNVPGPGPAAARAAHHASMRGFAVHAAIYVGINAILLLIWATTTPGGYFWPFWTLVPLGLVLGIHAAHVAAPHLAPGVGGRGRSTPRRPSCAASSATCTTAPRRAWAPSPWTSASPATAWPRRATSRPATWWPARTRRPSARSWSCATWPAASIRPCSATGAWRRRSAR